jgi:hypothetical protein
MPRPSPQLPADFVTNVLSLPFMKGFVSVALLPEFQETRFAMTNGRDFLSADHLVAVLDGPAELGGDVQRTNLHIAAMVGDPILVCEMIRLGATIDMADASGKTPLFLAVESLAHLSAALAIGVDQCVTADLPKGRSMKRTHTVQVSRNDGLLRLQYVIRLLLEQHADPNCSGDGQTPLHMACKFQNWDLIELLLTYGANPLPPRPPGSRVPSPPTFFRSNADKARFRALIASTSGSSRPPRMCPCFSGNTLATCHDAEDKPFPLDFLCRCGSQKNFRKCCSKRRFTSYERWNEAEQWILPCETRPSPFLVPVGEPSDDFVDVAESAGVTIPKINITDGEVAAIYQQCAAELSSRGLIDPAFEYAMKRVDFIPR